MSASVATGATFALFTSESTVNIAVTAAKVQVSAQVTKLVKYVATKNADGTVTYGEGTDLKPTFDKAGNLELSNLLPGEKYDVVINIENASSIAVQYRTKFLCNEGEKLMAGMTVNGVQGVKKYSSAWTDWTDKGTQTETLTLELPYGASNAFNGESAKIAVSVEAVQGNAGYTGGEEIERVYYVTDTASAPGGFGRSEGRYDDYFCEGELRGAGNQTDCGQCCRI